MSETLVRLRYFVVTVVCLISSYYLVCYYGVIIIVHVNIVKQMLIFHMHCTMFYNKNINTHMYKYVYVHI